MVCRRLRQLFPEVIPGAPFKPNQRNNRSKFCQNAAKAGYLNVLQWAWIKGAPLKAAVCANAASNGHFAVVQWAKANGAEWRSRYVCLRAARNEHFDILDWASSVQEIVRGDQDKICYLDIDKYIKAAKGGHLKALQWMKANGNNWGNGREVCIAAAGSGNLEMLQWVLSTGVSFKSYATEEEAREGHSKMFLAASENGHSHITEWLKANHAQVY